MFGVHVHRVTAFENESGPHDPHYMTAGLCTRMAAILLALLSLSACLGNETVHAGQKSAMAPPTAPPSATPSATPSAPQDSAAQPATAQQRSSQAAFAPASVESPLVVIGADGLEWRLVLAMSAGGRLPNITQLMKTGIAGRLATLDPTRSPTIWTTIATGVAPEKHGIKGFLIPQRERRQALSPLYRSSDRKVKAIWNILSERGLRSAVIGWWNTFPVENINGVMVAQVNTLRLNDDAGDGGLWKGGMIRGLAGQVHPRERARELGVFVAKVEDSLDRRLAAVAGEFKGPEDPVFEKLWQASRWSLRADFIYEDITEHLLADDAPFDFLALYLGAADVLSHRFWRYRFPSFYQNPPSPCWAEKYGPIIDRYYEHLDTVVGRIAEAMGDNATVVLVSDHGMAAENSSSTFDAGSDVRGLRSAGHRSVPDAFFLASGPTVAARRQARTEGKSEGPGLPMLGHVSDVTPTLLALLGLPSARDMDGKVMASVIDPAFKEKHPLSRIDSYTAKQWRPSTAPLAPLQNQHERLDQLRALGYIR